VNRAGVLAHVRRYPRWYAVAVVWLVAMLALPIVSADPLDLFTPDRSTGATAATGSPSGSEGTAPGATVGTAPDGTPTTAGGRTGGEQAAAGDDEPSALDLVPPELLDLIFESLPPLVTPPLPAELAPLAAAIAPVATYGCSGLGLASVVVAVVAQSAQGVPVEKVLPYLAPVVTVCAAFPIPPTHTVCASDVPLIVDVGGLTKGPPILGLGIDQLEAVERLLSSTFGTAVPSVAAGLRTQLDCDIVTT
jgi:hypothetical protein